MPQNREVAHNFLDAWPLHFHHHRLASEQGGAMHLRDGGGAERLLFDARENLRQGPLEFSFQHRADFIERQRRDLVLKFRKFLGAAKCGCARPQAGPFLRTWDRDPRTRGAGVPAG